MKFVLASYGSRGDIEPCVALGRELLRRGHEVRMAVPPDLIGFAESAGLAAVAYGPDMQAVAGRAPQLLDVFVPQLLEDPGTGQVVARTLGARYPVLGGDEHDADVVGGRGRPAIHRPEFREAAANVAEYYDIPLATLHYVPSAGQRPAGADPAVAVGPLRNDGDRVAGVGG